MNRKLRVLRHVRNFLPHSVCRNFPIEEVKAGLVITIRADVDRNVFTDLQEVRGPINSRLLTAVRKKT